MQPLHAEKRLRLPRIALLILCSSVLAGLPSAQGQRTLDDEDLEALGAGLKAYVEARTAALGVDEARASVGRALAALESRAAGRDPLAHAADLGRGFELSRGLGKRKLKKGKVVEEVHEGGSFGRGLEYAYRVPRSYQPSEKRYALVVAIPDEGETPADHIRSSWSEAPFQEWVLVVCPRMPEERAEWDQVMVAGRPGGLCHVLSALRIAEERFAVDHDRIYVVGHGKGVPAAVAAGNYSPQRFAGIVGRRGDAGELAPDNFDNLPTFFIGGGSNARAFQEKAGSEASRIEPEASADELWRWMLDHPRVAGPEKVRLVVGKPFPTRAYWLRVAPSAPDAGATAEIDREANRLTIRGHGISHATLYLNDALVDLSRPVEVVCNENEVTVELRRHLSTVLDLYVDGTSDPANVYVCEARFDMATGALVGGASGVAEDPEFDEKLAAAGDDPVRLWELSQWCLEYGRPVLARGVLSRLLRSDPDHARAREALGHRSGAGRWFASEASYRRFQASQEGTAARARGYVKHKDLWLHKEDRVRAGKGLVKDPDTGLWLSVADRKKLAGGWVMQDLEWIPPGEVGHVDRGLWKVDGEWVGQARADRHHAKIEHMWHIPSSQVLLNTTCDRAVALRAVAVMESAVGECRRVFGAEPVLPLQVTLLRDEEQYDRFSFGDPDGRRLASHAGRANLVHSAFYAESLFPFEGGKRRFAGQGVGYWDTLAPHGDFFGANAARLALGLSFAEALDPSKKAVRAALARGPGAGFHDAYQAEKRIPAWLRFGAAVYAERFYRDTSVPPDGDEWWVRTWSIENLKNKGELRALKEIFAFELNPEDRSDAQKLQIEAGLVVAFLVDGDCGPVKAAHGRLKAQLAGGRLSAKTIQDLEAAISDNAPALRAFAGL